MRDRYLQLDYPEMADEIQKKLRPDKPLKEKVLRVQLRTGDKELFERIIIRTCSKGESDPAACLPASKERQALRASEQHVAENFEAIKRGIDKLDKEKLNQLYVYLMERCFVMFSELPTPKMARSFVTGQNRGKNVEPIDEFKGRLILGGVTGEAEQDKYLAK